MSSTQLRKRLLLQLGYLVDELEATRCVSQRLTPAELESCLTGPSVKERYGHMADWDRTVVLPLLRHMQGEDVSVDVEVPHSAKHWNAMAFATILDAVQAAREALVTYVSALPPAAWTCTGTLQGQTYDVFGLLHALALHDADQLQQVARQLQRSV